MKVDSRVHHRNGPPLRADDPPEAAPDAGVVRGFARVPKVGTAGILATLQRAPLAALLTIAELVDARTGDAVVSDERLAKAAGFSVRTASQAIACLADRGLLIIEERGNGRGRASRYRVPLEIAGQTVKHTSANPAERVKQVPLIAGPKGEAGCANGGSRGTERVKLSARKDEARFDPSIQNQELNSIAPPTTARMQANGRSQRAPDDDAFVIEGGGDDLRCVSQEAPKSETESQQAKTAAVLRDRGIAKAAAEAIAKLPGLTAAAALAQAIRVGKERGVRNPAGLLRNRLESGDFPSPAELLEPGIVFAMVESGWVKSVAGFPAPPYPIATGPGGLRLHFATIEAHDPFMHRPAGFHNAIAQDGKWPIPQYDVPAEALTVGAIEVANERRSRPTSSEFASLWERWGNQFADHPGEKHALYLAVMRGADDQHPPWELELALAVLQRSIKDGNPRLEDVYQAVQRERAQADLQSDPKPPPDVGRN